MADTTKELEINDEISNQNTAPQPPTEPATSNKLSLSKKKKIILIATFAIVECFVLTIFAVFFGIPYSKYHKAVSMMDTGEYQSAIYTFEQLDNFMDSHEMVIECKYRKADSFLNAGKYIEAITIFEELGDYKDCTEKITQSKYLSATSLMESGSYEEAIAIFEKLGDYEDSKSNIQECNYLKACALMDKGSYKDAQTIFESISEYKDSKDNITECKYKIALKLIDEGNIVEAYKKLTALKGYKESKKKAESIEDAYNMIMAKPNIFVSRNWRCMKSPRSFFKSTVIDENTMKFNFGGTYGLADHSDETFIATWDPSTGRLNYTDGTCYFNSNGVVSCIYTDGTGYFYYQNGYLYWVNNKQPGHIEYFG